MKYPVLGPVSGAISIGLVMIVSQQTGINISTELLLSILINVAIIALAFGKIQANQGHIKETMGRIEKAIDEDVKRIEKRVESVAKRYHNVANELLGRKLMNQLEEDDDDQN